MPHQEVLPLKSPQSWRQALGIPWANRFRKSAGQQDRRPKTFGEAMACVKRLEAQLTEARAQAAVREADLQALSLQDMATGLPNQEAFAQAVGAALAQSGRRDEAIAVLLIDLNGFDTFKDAMGAGAADKVLVGIAVRLHGAIRESDILGRMAGDRFAVLLRHLKGEAAAIHAAERILQSMNQPIIVGSDEARCAASIGISTSQGYPSIVGQTLIQRAEIAVQRAISAGGGRFHFFDAVLHEEAEEASRIKAALAPAVNIDQFHMEFQPRIDMRSGQPCGVEALVRWDHPTLGPVSPARFIPIAERCGQILPLCEWIADEVFRCAALWRTYRRTAGVPLLPIAMNLSIAQLRNSDLRQQLEALARSYSVPAAAIELEVTETAAIDDVERIADLLAGLRADGYRVAIDDFGTGYASLALAVSLPADYLKIDRSFISNMLTSRRHAAAVATTLALGRSMDLTVVAEGVETEQQALHLQARGCDQAQGYWIGEPMPFIELMQWLKHYQPLLQDADQPQEQPGLVLERQA
jgi:diguanylate cyclase (GGDEF)-like protein